MLTASNLYAPDDTDEAYAAWTANCGPAALAALLGRPVMTVREFFPTFPARPWCNPTHMRAALDAAGYPHRVVPPKTPGAGLVFIQLAGPWTAPGAPVAAAYRNTHWVAVNAGLIYDVNAGMWLARREWEKEVMSHIIAHTPKATGWSIRTRLAVDVGARS